MNRRTVTKVCFFTAVGATIGIASAKDDGKVGDMTPADFDKTNKDAGEKIKALKADASKLSEDDLKYLGEIAMGGMFQLEASKLVAGKGQGADIKLYALGEVAEQTGLSDKLKEVASAKGTTLPTAMDKEAEKTIAKLKGLSGREFDEAYLKQVGIAGHKVLKDTMEKVKSKAKDPVLKQIAENALPLIEIHLAAATAELKMS
ncbi:DUF4142 domain-containing protein [Luteolibacter ambystomatis]|uniref:DUF4142 domain-containing protein n=1 Tax=Luteolibacter ambystomatis TaxID=2824561 RepID=A0A975PHD4_9BACT|nr:DUF4142 domain-containing protein [Luteolibacter ambystomatis]QUE53217.1 DUF4142 domain-containing protein [Luteolibacter ambystomatis]